MRLRLEQCSAGREQICQALRAENIDCNVHYIPIPRHPYYQQLGYQKGVWPVAETAYEELLTLPLADRMLDQDVTDVTRAFNKIVTRYAP